MQTPAQSSSDLDAGKCCCSRHTLPLAVTCGADIFHDLHGTLNGRVTRHTSMLYGCTCNLSITAAAVPLDFDEAFRAAAFEDVEFCVRARKLGTSIQYEREAVMRHHYNPGIWGLFRCCSCPAGFQSWCVW